MKQVYSSIHKHPIDDARFSKCKMDIFGFQFEVFMPGIINEISNKFAHLYKRQKVDKVKPAVFVAFHYDQRVDHLIVHFLVSNDFQGNTVLCQLMHSLLLYAVEIMRASDKEDPSMPYKLKRYYLNFFHVLNGENLLPLVRNKDKILTQIYQEFEMQPKAAHGMAHKTYYAESEKFYHCWENKHEWSMPFGSTSVDQLQFTGNFFRLPEIVVQLQGESDWENLYLAFVFFFTCNKNCINHDSKLREIQPDTFKGHFGFKGHL